MNTKIEKYLAIGLSLLAILVIGWLVHESSLSAKLTLEVAPKGSSKILINGKGRRAGEESLKPGTYVVSISHPGFTTASQSIVLRKGDSQYYGVALTSNIASTASWYIDHPADKKLAEGISSKNSDQLFKNQESRLPLIKDLPFIDLLYRIDYGPSIKKPNDSSAIAIYIKYYSAVGKQQAIDWLKFKGYSVDKLEVVYQDASTTQ